MKPKRLALLLSLVSGFLLGLGGFARAGTAEMAPVASTSAEQFALMGGVFLILGGTFVFAPQIVSAVNGFMAAVFRRPRKPSKTVVGAAEASQAPTIHVLDVPESQPAPHVPAPVEYQPGAWEPVPEPHEAPRSDVVSRLREEISSSWSGTHGD